MEQQPHGPVEAEINRSPPLQDCSGGGTRLNGLMLHRLALCLLLTIGSSMAKDHPNLLWITAEDMSAFLGCWGDDYAHTPNIDRLAKESVRFTHVFATAPVCSPSRSCLITGVYAQTLGTHQMRSDFAIPESIKAWPSYLRAAGYYTTNNVKTDYNTASEGRLIGEAWDENSKEAHWRNRPDAKQPFFAIFNDMTTHQSRSMTWSHEKFQREIQSRLAKEHIHDPDKAPVPPYYPDTPVVRRTIARHYDCISVMDQNTGRLLEQLEEDGLSENTIVFFYSDHGSGLPRHKRLLHDSGMHLPLLIRFPGKYAHLAPAQPGETVDDLISFVDFPPTMLRLLGIAIPDHMQGRPFLHPRGQDRMPRRFAYGARDRIDEVFDFSRSVRTKDYLYICNYMPHFGWNQRSVYPDQSEIRHEFYRLKPGELTPAQRGYAGETRPKEELYFNASDPHQVANLAGHPEHADALKKMREHLRETALAIRDLGYLPELDQVNLTREKTAYELGKDPERFPLEELIDTADEVFAPQGKPEALLVQQLGAEHPLLVLQAARDLQLRGHLSPASRKAVGQTLDTWAGRKDTPLALFIRFSCEAILGIKTEY